MKGRIAQWFCANFWSTDPRHPQQQPRNAKVRPFSLKSKLFSVFAQ